MSFSSFMVVPRDTPFLYEGNTIQNIEWLICHATHGQRTIFSSKSQNQSHRLNNIFTEILKILENLNLRGVFPTYGSTQKEVWRP